MDVGRSQSCKGSTEGTLWYEDIQQGPYPMPVDVCVDYFMPPAQ